MGLLITMFYVAVLVNVFYLLYACSDARLEISFSIALLFGASYQAFDLENEQGEPLPYKERFLQVAFGPIVLTLTYFS